MRWPAMSAIKELPRPRSAKPTPNKKNAAASPPRVAIRSAPLRAPRLLWDDNATKPTLASQATSTKTNSVVKSRARTAPDQAPPAANTKPGEKAAEARSAPLKKACAHRATMAVALAITNTESALSASAAIASPSRTGTTPLGLKALTLSSIASAAVARAVSEAMSQAQARLRQGDTECGPDERQSDHEQRRVQARQIQIGFDHARGSSGSSARSLASSSSASTI